MELINILRTVRRWWLLIVLLPVVTATALWGGSRFREPTYEATVKLQITTPQREDVAVYDEYRYGSLRDEITVARNNFTEMLQGDDVCDETVLRLGLTDEEREFSIQVDPARDADFVYVTVAAGDPVVAANVANALVEVAIDHYGDLRARATYAERDLFADKLAAAEADFHAAQARFTQFQVVNGVVSLAEQLDTYHRLLEQLQLERDRLLLEETTRAGDPVAQVEGLIAQHQRELDRLAALVPTYHMLLDDVELARERYQSALTEVDADEALEELRAAEADLAGFRTQHGIVLLDDELKTYQQLLTALQLERDQMLLDESARGDDAIEDVDQLIIRRQEELDRLSALLPAYELLSDELVHAREQYAYILSKYTEADLTAAAVKAANFIQVVESAQPPTEPTSSATMLLLAVAGSVGVGVLLAFLVDYVVAAVDDTLHIDAEDGLSVLGLPVLGMMPSTADGRCAPNSLAGEAVRQLRTRLDMASPDGRVQTLLVTSPQPKDGKSVIAANLARAMAAGGVRVVLVDADLRMPGLDQWFKRSNERGLTDWLATDGVPPEQLIPELVQHTDIPGLSLVTTGPPPQDASILLSSDRLRAVIEALSEDFDRVILDGPPVVVAPDTIGLARLVQSTLLVVSPDRTSRRLARHALALLTSLDDIHLIGAALNRTSLETYGYHYYGYLSGGPEKEVWYRRVLGLLSRGRDGARTSVSKGASAWAVRLDAIRGFLSKALSSLAGRVRKWLGRASTLRTAIVEAPLWRSAASPAAAQLSCGSDSVALEQDGQTQDQDEGVVDHERSNNQLLSAREIEVLRLAQSGLYTAQIALELQIQPGTVRSHISAACDKLGVRTRQEALQVASELGVI